jgi:hypothetical protein
MKQMRMKIQETFNLYIVIKPLHNLVDGLSLGGLSVGFFLLRMMSAMITESHARDTILPCALLPPESPLQYTMVTAMCENDNKRKE